ncbi:hypothetical protein HDU83_004954 [Entophlyctis luteolus]|nr:hypothetical protein HDU83_004954 [Entophlyctis luteolus]
MSISAKEDNLILPPRIFDVAARLTREIHLDLELAGRVHVDGYHAVSHVWGKCEKIALAGVPWVFDITSAAKIETIIVYATRANIKWLWMDVLCIDQSSEIDKAKNLPLMGSIYSHATSVLVVLGAEIGMVEAEFLAALRQPPPSEVPVVGTLGTKVSPEFARVSTAVCRFFTDDWFWRVWTFQECILARKTTVITETGHVFTNEVDDWLAAFQVLQRRFSKSYPGWIVHLDHLRTEQNPKQSSRRSLASIMNLADIRVQFRPMRQSKHAVLPIARVVAAIADRDTAYEDDRIFGILGLLSYGNWFRPIHYGDIVAAWKLLANLAIDSGDLSVLSFKRVTNTGPSNQDSLPPSILRNTSISFEDLQPGGFDWLGVLHKGGAPTEYESMRLLDVVATSPKNRNSFHFFKEVPTTTLIPSAPHILQVGGRLSIDCVFLGDLRWVAGPGITDDDPEELWNCLLPKRTKDMEDAAGIIVAKVKGKDCSNHWADERLHKEFTEMFEADGVKTHSLWDIRNTLDMIFQQYGNRCRRDHCGRVAVMKAVNGEDHILVLDQEVSVGAQVYGYSVVSRGDAGDGFMVLVCNSAGDNQYRVAARSTPMHTVAMNNLQWRRIVLV